MEKAKTGALIAAARKEKNMTQKDLADMLHVSDRAVSKWERGAGFPDVSLLEPLAAALELEVLDLLRGERTEETDVHAAVQEALNAFQEKQRQRKREERRAKLGFGAVLLGLLICLTLTGIVRIPVRHTVLAGVYENGVQTAVTEVQVEGSIRIGVGRAAYWGQLRVPLDKISMEPERKRSYKIPITGDGEAAHAVSKSWFGNILESGRPFIGNQFCLTLFMREFAFNVTDGKVIATSPGMYVRYAETYHAVLPEQAT